MRLKQTQQQKQALSQAQQQSLHVLQMPILSLREYLTEIALGNPLIEIEGGADDFLTQMEQPAMWEEDDSGRIFDRSPGVPRSEDDEPPEMREADAGETFTEHLLAQLNMDRSLPREYLPLCCFLVESLNSRGYLDEPVEVLAEVKNVPTEHLMQALYAVQSLSPTGVGARSLQECLILQLIQTHDFNPYTMKIIKSYLPLLAKNSIRSIAGKLGQTENETLQYCNAIRRLNPIPSRGFPTRENNRYIIPEAVVRAEGGRFVIHYNQNALPQIRMNTEYLRMLDETTDRELHGYLQKNRQQAVQLRQQIEARESTIVRLIRCVLDTQIDFITGKRKTPVPMTVNETSLKLGVHSSTVSRAVREKYVVLPNCGMVLLKSLFSTSVGESAGQNKAMIQERIRYLVEGEDHALPLSDESIKEALAAMDIRISRRTVAAYREEMGIPATSGRRVRR